MPDPTRPQPAAGADVPQAVPELRRNEDGNIMLPLPKMLEIAERLLWLEQLAREQAGLIAATADECQCFDVGECPWCYLHEKASAGGLIE